MWNRIMRLMRRIVDGEAMDDPEVGREWEPDDVDDAADWAMGDPHWR